MTTLFETPDPRMLRIGDVFKFTGKFVVVYRVNESGAKVQPLARRQKSFTAPDQDPESAGFRKQVKFSEPEKPFTVSARSEVDLIVRLGDDWRTKNLADEVPGFVGEPLNTGNGNENNMSKKKINNPRGGLAAEAAATKTSKAAKVKTEKAEGEGRQGILGQVCGHSCTSVLRALGKDGVTAAQARGIFASKTPEAKALGLPITIANGTVSIQIGKGKAGTMDPAPLTKEQLTSLKALIPADTQEDKPKEKAKGKKGAKKTDAAETTEAPASEATPAAKE